MGVVAVLITSAGGAKLLSKHYRYSDAPEPALLLERSIARHTQLYSNSQASRRAMTIEGMSVVAGPVGELLLYVVGSGQDADELILAQVFDVVVALLDDCLKHRLEPSELLSDGNQGKMYACLDEVVCCGDVQCLDANAALKLSKMRYL